VRKHRLSASLARSISLLLLLVPYGRAAAKSYYYPEIQTQVYLDQDGNARVIQQRTYEFNGDFSWADIDLKKQGAADIVFDGLVEQTGTGWQAVRPQEVTNSDKSLYIRWGYSAEDEAKTFQLEYTVKGAVKRYQDVAEFYWKVIEDNHERVSRTRTDIYLPADSPNRFRVYVHAAALPGRLEFNPARTSATVEQGLIPKDAFVEVRVLSSPEIFSGVAVQPVNRYQSILNQEKGNFLVSSLRRFVMLPLGVILLIAVPLILLLVFYFKYGREPHIDYDATYEHEPPRNAPPMTLPVILLGKQQMDRMLLKGMFATLLDLCRKGIVSAHDEVEGRRHRYSFHLDHPEKLAEQDAFSRRVGEFMFDEAAGGGVLTQESLKSWSQNHVSEAKVMLGSFMDDSLDWWEKELGTSLFDPASSRAYTRFLAYLWLSVAAGMLGLAAGLTRFIGGGRFGPLPVAVAFGFVPGLAFSFAGRVINRWTPVAYLENKRWVNFRKFLKDFSAIRQAPISLLAIWEQYYVYATVLGVAREFLSHVGRLATEQGAPLAMPLWFQGGPAQAGLAGMSSLTSGMAGFASFASNFTGMMDSFSATAATGGGFSGGGGGGGGGGSSGAG
jgi:uncharacterized membrane protein